MANSGEMGNITDEKPRCIVTDTYRKMFARYPDMPFDQIKKMVSDSLGTGKPTNGTIVNEQTETVPKQKRSKTDFLDTLDEFDMSAVRTHVHNIWFARKVPTVDSIHKAVSDDNGLPTMSRVNLCRLLEVLDFRHADRNQNGVLTEGKKLVEWRRRYLRDIQRYREEGRHIYYIDETRVYAGVECTSKIGAETTIREHLIALNIGSEDGFADGTLLCLESTNEIDNGFNGDTFREWMEAILPLLKPNSVLVLDNAPCHTVMIDRPPPPDARKADMIRWLADKGVVIDGPIVIPELLQMVKRLKPQYEKYVIDALAEANNHTVLRLPPFHCELNPMDLVWESVKTHVRMNDSTHALENVKKLLIEGVNRINSDSWKIFIHHAQISEKAFYNVDFVIDEVLAAYRLNNTGDEKIDSDSE